MNTSEIWEAIIAAPGDENLRTQYVEALAREGDWRAEMFRLEAEIDKLKSAGQIYKAEALMPRYEGLVSNWRGGFDADAGKWRAELKLVKCWPVEITIEAADFIRVAPSIVAAVPLRHLNLTAINERPEVFDVPQFRQIATLDGSGQPWADEAVCALAASPHLQSLRWLDLSRTGLTEAQVERLAAAACLRHLEHVDLRDNPSRDPVDAAAGYGVDWESNGVILESVHLPDFGRELESRHGEIGWLHFLDRFCVSFPQSRYRFGAAEFR